MITHITLSYRKWTVVAAVVRHGGGPRDPSNLDFDCRDFRHDKIQRNLLRPSDSDSGFLRSENGVVPVNEDLAHTSVQRSHYSDECGVPQPHITHDRCYAVITAQKATSARAGGRNHRARCKTHYTLCEPSRLLDKVWRHVPNSASRHSETRCRPPPL
ncbi:uncharacterized protein K489DRAFT_198437 [Dissoconium aciculare CBS 342.82]|uniref:Uncharacterized protein n=1 Tax=Dissoconium aciculare CBS 342.82 TaxID=1314786 RepID=A0A6J3M660_9PEZI|nr:uncharacterized protein K489DRAFT_198437 [Dissoconium aciculare CBS 342.82]KAF1823515.1 hypothetical protein K489DRAFT_198437 [Dissoconium aciculare CBS 342.82]